MASKDFDVIIEKLQERFLKGRIVFWYDEEGDFAESLPMISEALSFCNVATHILLSGNQFYTKYLLERKEPERKFLVYAKFGKPPVADNCLEDTLLYSSRFSADPREMLVNELGIKPEYKQLIIEHFLFFRSRERKEKFIEINIDVEPGEWTERTIYVGMLRVITKTHSAIFDDILIKTLNEGLEDNPYLSEFKKYGIDKSFWQLCKDHFGYDDDYPTLERMVLSLFVTYVKIKTNGKIPEQWKDQVSFRQHDVTVFMDGMMDSTAYSNLFVELSGFVSEQLKVPSVFKSMNLECLLNCDAFTNVDDLFVTWIRTKLLNKDLDATISERHITDICNERRKKFFGTRNYSYHYDILIAAHSLISAVDFVPAPSFAEMAEQYASKDYSIDCAYRTFYDAFNHIYEQEEFEDLRQLVENVYTNEYLSRLLIAWNQALDIEEMTSGQKAQRRFFFSHIYGKDKTAVIVSDALRYDVGMELYEELMKELKNDVKMDYMFSSLPAYTQLGMASLLPHEKLEILPDKYVLSDGFYTDGTEKRETVLRKALPNSRCIQDSDLKSRNESRELFNSMDVVYIYHNQIDIRGKDAMGDEVFTACNEAIKELTNLVKKIGNANVYRIIITADHGFLYRWDGIRESDKIDLDRLENDAILDRRFIISKSGVESMGAYNIQLGKVLGTYDSRILSWPIGPDVFKVKGGLKFVHGGASPQENIIPLITVKVGREKVETRPAEIVLSSTVNKVTNLFQYLEFFQKEPIGDDIVPATYKVFFQSDRNEKVSNEIIIVADRKDSNPSRRTFREKFSMKEKRYDKNQKYWLIVKDNKTGAELFRKEFVIDVAFSSGISFD